MSNMKYVACAGATLLYALACNADIRLASDWYDPLNVPSEHTETNRLNEAMVVTASRLSATSAGTKGKVYKPTADLPFQVFIDGTKYYIQPAIFMAKDRPDEVCSPTHFKNVPIYRCDEGQSYKESCHLMFFNSQFKNVGIHRFNPDEPYESFCNAVPAIGTADKTRNELLVTFQYFPIDRKVASKVSEIGDGWKRMTSLFRLKLVEGKIEVEEDDSCFGKPNAIETIPDARAALKRCHSAAR